MCPRDEAWLAVPSLFPHRCEVPFRMVGHPVSCSVDLLSVHGGCAYQPLCPLGRLEGLFPAAPLHGIRGALAAFPGVGRFSLLWTFGILHPCVLSVPVIKQISVSLKLWSYPTAGPFTFIKIIMFELKKFTLRSICLVILGQVAFFPTFLTSFGLFFLVSFFSSTRLEFIHQLP